MDVNIIEPVEAPTLVQTEVEQEAVPSKAEKYFSEKFKNVLPDDFFVDFKILLYSSIPLVCWKFLFLV
jgi:hypothetical protein